MRKALPTAVNIAAIWDALRKTLPQFPLHPLVRNGLQFPRTKSRECFASLGRVSPIFLGGQ